MHTRTEKNNRAGISVVELTDMFPDEAAARKWLEGIRWGDDKHCPHCGSLAVVAVKNEKPMPYRCKSCRKHFSVRTGTIIQKSRLPLRKWVFAIYLLTTSLKGVSSMKLFRDLGMTQKSAWLLAQKIRQCFIEDGGQLSGEVEVDETHLGGRERNKHARKRIKGHRGPVGKDTIIGAQERGGRIIAKRIETTDGRTLRGFVNDVVEVGSRVYTDDHGAYKSLDGLLYTHQAVRHKVGEYVNGMATTNGIESFWALLKRGYQGTYHKMSGKHLPRYINEFAGRHNIRTLNTIDQMAAITRGFIGKRMTYKELIAE